MLEQKRELWKNGAPITTPCRLEIELWFTPRSHARSDLDNRVKALQDVLQTQGVIENDSLIDELVVKRAGKHKKGKAVVVITPLEQGD